MASLLSKVRLRWQLAVLVGIALLPGFALLFWLRGEVRELQSQDITQRATQLAQLVAETQVSRTQGVEQLIATLGSIPHLRTDAEACGAFFRELLSASTVGFLNFGLLDSTGRVRCSAAGAPGQSLADNPAFQETIATGVMSITPAVRGRLVGLDVFAYMRRLPADGGPPVVAFVGFGLDTVAASLARVPLPQDASLALITGDGRVIAAYPPEGAGPMHSVQPRVADMAVAGGGVFTAEGDDGISRTFAAVRVGSPDTLLAVAALPTTASALADTRFLAATLIFGACSVLTLLVGLIVADRGIRAPIQQLVDAMARVRRGGLEARVGLLNASPEVRSLSEGFDEMTAQLEQRETRTRQAQRLEAVGHLSGGIAHDFNNMLTVIIGFGEELRAHVLPGGRAHLDEILGAGTRAKELTQQLLAFSRRQMLKAEPIQLTRAVDDLSRMLRRLIGEHIDLDLRLAGDLPLIQADRTQLEQVITNLVVNARDAMGDGGTLTLKTDSFTARETDLTRADMPPGRYVRLTVADTGHGMDAETLSHVFEPFYTTKALGKGTGLGLATVYGVVRQSGGHVTVHSSPDDGTTFEIFFPAIDATEAPPPAPAPEPRTSRSGETILVVEDEAGVRRLAVTILSRAGYTVLQAGDAIEAMHVVEAHGTDIDMLLSDVVLPGGCSGIALSRTLKDARPELVVMHMSGYAAELSSTAPRDASFLAKPFTPAAMLRAVHAALGHRMAGEPSSTPPR